MSESTVAGLPKLRPVVIVEDEPVDRGPAFGSGCFAFASGLLIGVGFDVIWLKLAPPRALGTGWAWLAVAVVAGVAALLGATAAGRVATRRWFGTLGATIWGVLLVGWVLVFPGASFGLAVLVFALGAVVGFVALTVVVGIRGRHRWGDGVAAGVLVVVAIAVAGSVGVEGGVRFRLALVRDRYERAIATNRVEDSGGFTHGDVAGWIWVYGMFDAATAVVFDPGDGIGRLTARAPISVGDVGQQMTCERLERSWYWCQLL